MAAANPAASGAKPAAPAARADVPASQGGEVSAYRWIILIGLVTASIMEVLDTTIVNVALPQMAGNLGATTTEIGWVSTGYILSNVVVLPMTAWLSGVFGQKRYIVGSILLFIIASFFCGTSHGLWELVFWRIVQGAGGAALLSTAQATLREIFPKEQQAMVQSIFLLGIVVAPTLGPTLGGWITDNYSWQWVFYINLPIGVISMFITGTFLEDSKYKSPNKGIDIPGILLLMVGLGSLQYVLEEGNADDWFQSELILGLSILAGICIVALVVWELWPSNKNPGRQLPHSQKRAVPGVPAAFSRAGLRLVRRYFPLSSVRAVGFALHTHRNGSDAPSRRHRDRHQLGFMRTAFVGRKAQGGSACLDSHRRRAVYLVYVGLVTPDDGEWHGRHPIRAHHPWLRAGLFVRAHQLRVIRGTIRAGGRARVGTHQLGQATGRLVRYRDFGYIRQQHDQVP